MRRRQKQILSVTLYVVGLVAATLGSSCHARRVYHREKAKCDAIRGVLLAGPFNEYICGIPK